MIFELDSELRSLPSLFAIAVAGNCLGGGGAAAGPGGQAGAGGGVLSPFTPNGPN